MAPMAPKDEFLACTYKQGNKPCTGRCKLSVAVHRASENETTVCFACKAGNRKTLYVIPPGTNRDPVAYRRPRNPRGAPGGVQPNRANAWTEEGAKDRQIAALQKQVLDNGGVLSPEEMAPTDAKLKYETLKAQVADLQGAGYPVPDLVAALKALEATEAQAVPTLRVLEGRMHDAENKAQQSNQSLVKLQELLNKAAAKCVAAELVLFETTAAYETAYAEKVAAKGWVRANDMDTVEPVLQQCPSHLDSAQTKRVPETTSYPPNPV